MISRSRMIYVVFFLTAVFISVVHLRTASTKLFNRSRIVFVEQKRLRQQLWQKQLELESLVNPNAISDRIKARQDIQSK